MLSDWELAEKKVKDLTGGRFTPASGAKKVKGENELKIKKKKDKNNKY